MPLLIENYSSSESCTAPECLTRIKSMEVDKGFCVKLAAIIIGSSPLRITWTLEDHIIEEGEHYTFENDETCNRYTLVITHITRNQEGTYRCKAENTYGSCSTMGFITVKENDRHRRKRSVSRRPKISTIKEWQSQEEEYDPDAEKQTLKNRHCWDWWNLGAASDDDDTYKKNKENKHKTEKVEKVNVDKDTMENIKNNKTKFERQASTLERSRSRSLPDISPAGQTDKYQKLKTFWETVTAKRK